jgi:hypothetical protein
MIVDLESTWNLFHLRGCRVRIIGYIDNSYLIDT